MTLHVLLVAAVALALPASGATAAPVPPERALYQDGPDGRHLLEEGWTTRADPSNRGLRGRWQREGRDAGFRPVQVPDAFNARDRSSRGFRSRVQWYRTRFALPRDGAATGWRLRFESVNRHATVFLNGRKLGEHEGAWLPFELRADQIRAGENELVVRVDGRLSPTDLPPSTRPRGWWNYGGIVREVYLRRVTALDMSDLQVTPRGSRIEVRGMVRNTSSRPLPLRYVVATTGPGGFGRSEPRRQGTVRPGGLGRLSTSFEVPAPRRWSPDSPDLYRVRVSLGDGQVIQAHVGFRDWAVDEGLATLDGRPLTLRGASFHEETADRGAALMPADRDEIVGELRALGADFTRQHYPPHPALLEAFDREGIVFWDQIPVWRLRGRQLGTRRVRRDALSRVRQMVLRDRNHASVMTWSVSNETLAGGRGEARYLREARRLVRRLDPTRLVAADTSFPLAAIPSTYRTMDAIGINEYVGWYGTSSTSELRPRLDALRERFPGQALFVTEFGAEANRDGPADEKGTYAFQSAYVGEHLDIMAETPYLSGALAWVLRDFTVRPAWSGGNPRPDSPYNRKGLFDERGEPKPAFEAARERFRAMPPTR